MLRKSLGLFALALVAGCASTPPLAMPSNQYQAHAYQWAVYEICGRQGKMDPTLAAYGKTRTEQSMYSYTFDAQRMNQLIPVVFSDEEPPSAEVCNQFAVKAAGLRDTYDRNVRASQSPSGYQYTTCTPSPLGTSCVSY